MYQRWRRLLPAWIQVVPVELPGRGIRLSEPYVDDFESLVTRLCDEQAPYLGASTFLFGHSMGALLAYGMARQQRDRGHVMPSALLVSGSPAPSMRDSDGHVVKHGDAELIADLQRQGGTPRDIFTNPELLRLTLDTLRADYRVCESFRYGAPEPLDMPVHAFAGRNDDIDMARVIAWEEEAGTEFSLEWFEGGHFFIQRQEQQLLASLVRVLAHQLAETSHAASVAT